MTQAEVIELFKSESVALEKTYARSEDTVAQLAKVIAHNSAHLSKEDFDALVHIGAWLVKQSDAQTRARAEIVATMKQAQDAASRSQS